MVRGEWSTLSAVSFREETKGKSRGFSTRRSVWEEVILWEGRVEPVGREPSGTEDTVTPTPMVTGRPGQDTMVVETSKTGFEVDCHRRDEPLGGWGTHKGSSGKGTPDTSGGTRTWVGRVGTNTRDSMVGGTTGPSREGSGG